MSCRIPYSNGKRYYTLDAFCKEKFGCKIAKISLNGGFTCPNRDGTKSKGGCIYCSDALSGDFAGNPADSIEKQFAEGVEKMAGKWKNTKYMAYFQAGTGTYAPLVRLKALYEAALSQKDAVALSIATRPDCISPETLDYLTELNTRTFLTVELGLQSISDVTGKTINRCTTYREFYDCFMRLKERGIAVCVHLINGLPGETREDMIENVRAVSELAPWAIKLHLLHVLRGTACETMYQNGECPTFEKEAYVSLVCDQLEYIDKNIVMQRLTGDGARRDLVSPLWSLKKFELLNAIDKEMLRRDSFQGIYT